MLFKVFKNIREKVLIELVEFTKPIYVRYFKRNQIAWQQNVKTLKRFPPNTLGNSLGLFLESKGFELLPKLEDHDVLHVLLNYKTTIAGEVKMQFFLLGNRKRSLYALFTAIIGVVLVPEKWSSFFTAYRKGQRCVNISNWDFEHLLCEPIDLLQKQIFGTPLKNQKLII
jgi:ubiquinone biosynthesis protein Coq4